MDHEDGTLTDGGTEDSGTAVRGRNVREVVSGELNPSLSSQRSLSTKDVAEADKSISVSSI